jgi:glycerol-3-phosphate cytidylyltransferase-like family protein
MHWLYHLDKNISICDRKILYYCARKLNAYYTRRLELAFDTKLIRTTCENEESAIEQYGVEVSTKLKARLSDFRAFKYVSELVAGDPQEIKSNPHSVYKVDLCDGYRIIFCSNHVELPSSNAGEIMWSKVSRIKILKIDKQ